MSGPYRIMAEDIKEDARTLKIYNVFVVYNKKTPWALSSLVAEVDGFRALKRVYSEYNIEEREVWFTKVLSIENFYISEEKAKEYEEKGPHLIV